MRILAYMRLMRPEVGLIGFMSYLIGVRLVARVELPDVLAALAVALVSTNGIYSLNSWADWRLDRVNKPHRPIPAGLISPEAALRYSVVLLAGSVVYPFFVARTVACLLLLLVLPALGVLYSVRPFRLKRYSVLSVLITGTGLVVPMLAGYACHAVDVKEAPLFLVLGLYCLSVVLLKDIEDVRGDRRFGMQNLFSRYGGRLLLVSVSALVADAVLLGFLPVRGLLKTFMFVLILSSASLILLFRGDINRLYRTVIRVAVVEGLAFGILLLP